MFAFFTNLLRLSRASTAAARAAAPDTAIAFKPGLVEQLQAEHRELVRLYEALVAAHTRGDFDASVANLKHFTYALRAHLLKENLHLYVYLKHVLRHDRESTELMSALRVEMGKIGRVLNDFVTRYTSSPWDQQAREDLKGELARIAEVLTLRIRQEEDVLYPMYMHPSRYR